jgi:hypothetical protein
VTGWAISPLGVVGNLRFTRTGVYAEYLLSGLPFVHLGAGWQDAVAAEHAELWRRLPSGAAISGLTVPVPTAAITRRMLHAHTAVRTATALPERARPWARAVRDWETHLAAHRLRRRIFWLSLPLDTAGAGGSRRRAWALPAGPDRDDSAALAGYRARAAELAAALPAAFVAKPASPEQIWWHWNYAASRGVWPYPLPMIDADPAARLSAAAFTPVRLDEAGAAGRGRRWRGARRDAEVYLRTFREPADGLPDAYQAVLALHRFPDSGIAWPRATIFKVLDDLSSAEAVLDWTIHSTFRPVDSAVAAAQHTLTNIGDQFRQRGPHADSDDELVRKLASGRELASELKRGTAERGVDVAIVVTVGAADPAALNAAADAVTRTYRRQSIAALRPRGGQALLWRAGCPGAETTARLGEVRNPTTTARFAKFVPLLANRLGNNSGVPLGVNITSPGLRDVVLLDLLGAPGRDHPANLVIAGSPGRGKSHCAKNLIRAWLTLGAGVHIFDPTEAREHQRALADVDGVVVIDAARPTVSLDGLRIFPYAEAAERTVDHLLPQLGFSALSPQAARLAAHLAAEARHARGIGSLGALIGYLRDLRTGRVPADDDLLTGLEGLRAQRLLAPLFDETLPVPDLAGARCVVWNFAGLALPTVDQEYTAHLHRASTPGQRAAQALYGLGADLTQSLFFARPGHPDLLVVEECAAWTHSPGGQRCANTVIRQGRKAGTGFVGISQHPITDFGVLETEFIDQRLCLGFSDAALAAATLRWCGRDLERHPDLLRNYVDNTSPVRLTDHGDDTVDDRHGRVLPGRAGEAFFLDEFGGFGKVRLFGAPTAALARAFDTNPHRAPTGER